MNLKELKVEGFKEVKEAELHNINGGGFWSKVGKAINSFGQSLRTVNSKTW